MPIFCKVFVRNLDCDSFPIVGHHIFPDDDVVLIEHQAGMRVHINLSNINSAVAAAAAAAASASAAAAAAAAAAVYCGRYRCFRTIHMILSSLISWGGSVVLWSGHTHTHTHTHALANIYTCIGNRWSHSLWRRSRLQLRVLLAGAVYSLQGT